MPTILLMGEIIKPKREIQKSKNSFSLIMLLAMEDIYDYLSLLLLLVVVEKEKPGIAVHYSRHCIFMKAEPILLGRDKHLLFKKLIISFLWVSGGIFWRRSQRGGNRNVERKRNPSHGECIGSFSSPASIIIIRK